jgi:hypothetical protein
VRHARADIRRSGAIIAGLAVTSVSYAVGTIRARRRASAAAT